MGCSTSSAAKVSRLPSKRCSRIDVCGHRCGGSQGEAGAQLAGACVEQCVGCVDPSCPHRRVVDVCCPVCLYAIDKVAPSIRLVCGHLVHYGCAAKMLRSLDWRGHEVSPAALNCPAGCGNRIVHPLLERWLGPFAGLFLEAGSVANRAAAEGRFEHNPDVYRIFQCHACAKIFSGGLRQCDVVDADDARTVLCEQCIRTDGTDCKLHGDKFCGKKCNYCCQMATFVCGWGTHFFCTSCHISAASAFHQNQWNFWHKEHAPNVPVCIPDRCPFAGVHPLGYTKAWRSPCLQCHRPCAALAFTSTPQPVWARKECESPGCTSMAHVEPAPCNGWGRHCCSGCMTWASNATMAPNPGSPPESCHDARCARVT